MILKKGDEVLLIRRQGSGYYDGWYALPAGHVEAGELPLGGLVREVKEELDITINPEDARLVHTMYRAKHDETGERVDLFFEVGKWLGEISNVEPEKCDDVRWFSSGALPENTVPYVKKAISYAEEGIGYSETGLDDLTA